MQMEEATFAFHSNVCVCVYIFVSIHTFTDAGLFYADFCHLSVCIDARSFPLCVLPCVCVCGVCVVCVSWAQLALGSGILSLIETLLGVYKDTKREKENAALVAVLSGHQNIPSALEWGFMSIFFPFFWGWVGGRVESVFDQKNKPCL